MSNNDNKILNAIAQINQRLDTFEANVNQRITDVREELGARIEAVRDELNDKIDSYHNTKHSPTLKQRVSKLENRVDVIETRVNEHDKFFNKLKVK